MGPRMMLQHVAVVSGCTLMAVLGNLPLKLLMAQTGNTPSTGEDFLWRVTSTLGALGILAWYFYVTQTRTIPAKDAEIAAERKAADEKIKDAHECAMKTVDKLCDELRQEREARMVMIRACEAQRHGPRD